MGFGVRGERCGDAVVQMVAGRESDPCRSGLPRLRVVIAVTSPQKPGFLVIPQCICTSYLRRLYER